MVEQESMVVAYLDRLGLGHRPRPDRESLTQLVQAHLAAMPFTTVEIGAGRRPAVTSEAMLDQIVTRGQGGWCFELNGALGWLLTQLGFSVRYLGAAVLLDGPNEMIDHMMLEVTVDRSYLVDVGFGGSLVRPLDLAGGPDQDGGSGRYGFLPSSRGATLIRSVDGIPEAQYRFTRVTHGLDDFAPVAQRLAADRQGWWCRRPLITRWLGSGDERVTLMADRLQLRRDGQVVEAGVAEAQWWTVAYEWFGLVRAE